MYTIVLAAGKTDYRNKSQGLSPSRHLTLVNGRPVISWVVGDVLKKTHDIICITVDNDDTDLQDFCRIHYERHPRVRICPVQTADSIISSVAAATEMLGSCIADYPVRIVLGDTYLINIPYTIKDSVYITNFELDSAEWCVASISPEGFLTSYINKQSGLNNHDYMALVGRYEFSSGKDLIDAVRNSIRKNKKDLSDILIEYDKHKRLYGCCISPESWIDFGHLEGLASARSRLVESRSFNSLSIDPLLPEITKKSPAAGKLECEYQWYTNIPQKLRSLAPRVLRTDKGSLTMEYYGYGTLAEKFLYADLKNSFWEDVLNRLFSIVELFRKYPAPCQSDMKSLYIHKTKERLSSLQKDQFWGNLLDLSTVEINGEIFQGIKTLWPSIEKKLHQLSSNPQFFVSHGDLCFNNILYDVHSGIFKLLDPRGNLDGTPSIYGDLRYDIAKLRHSFCGNYDAVIEGDYFVEKIDTNAWHFEIFKKQQKEREKIFDNLCARYGFHVDEIKFIEALLFLTMIPLHSDSPQKQLCFFLTALQKFNRYMEEYECVSV